MVLMNNSCAMSLWKIYTQYFSKNFDYSYPLICNIRFFTGMVDVALIFLGICTVLYGNYLSLISLPHLDLISTNLYQNSHTTFLCVLSVSSRI